MSAPTIEFFQGISEELSNVSLRRSRFTGVRSVLLTFKSLQAIERFNSFTKRFTGTLCLTDSEGEISIIPSKLQFIFSGDEGDDLQRVECGFEIDQEDHWERFMRFMDRYAEANGMGYTDKQTEQSS
ncbi:MAG: photosystem II reaction center protein Psb28 [Chloroflexaceae bacterium]|nr:photosystem II reaction center protein Psb28 [Chloroflexaceae bacterium]